jgi:predicted DNA-binding protein
MKHTPEEIKNRLSNIGEAIGGIALEYIAELEAQIEKMKCCYNCENCEYYRLGSANIHCKLGVGECINYNKWEIKEK